MYYNNTIYTNFNESKVQKYNDIDCISNNDNDSDNSDKEYEELKEEVDLALEIAETWLKLSKK